MGESITIFMINFLIPMWDHLFESRTLFVLLIQWITMASTYFLGKKHHKYPSMKLGAIFTFLVLFVKDALPWISIWKTEFLFQTKYHHSRLGIAGLLIYTSYWVILEFLNNNNPIVCKIRWLLEEKEWGMGPVRINLLYFGLAVAIILLETQLHEILYFQTLKFPDRGFPLDIKLRLIDRF